MTRKAYIECPLEAALAAKNFEFKLLYGVGTDEPDQVATNEDFAAHYLDESEVYYWIAPESLPLLEPIVGDLLHGSHDNRKLYNDSYFVLPEDFNLQCYGWTFKIIQRNNKPFPTIQYAE